MLPLSSKVIFTFNMTFVSLCCQNSRYKQFGFELVTDDERIFYPLAADSEEELDDWISLLNRAIRMEVEETDAGGCITWVLGGICGCWVRYVGTGLGMWVLGWLCGMCRVLGAWILLFNRNWRWRKLMLVGGLCGVCRILGG